MLVVAMLAGIAAFLPSCYIGTMICEHLADVGDRAYRSLWYKVPVKHQKHVLLLIQYAQINRKITALGLVYCNLNTFVQVMHSHGWRRYVHQFSPIVHFRL